MHLFSDLMENLWLVQPIDYNVEHQSRNFTQTHSYGHLK